ncbi:MAG: hypothetical protein WAW96_15740, partial [Alphaproteobacteria bacterium]
MGLKPAHEHLVRRPVLLASLMIVVSLSLTSAASAAAQSRAWFWLSSDQIRAMRDVGPTHVLVINWKKHVEVLQSPQQAQSPSPPTGASNARVNEKGIPTDTQGTLVIGPDYLQMLDADGMERIVDFKLRRWIAISPDGATFDNDDLIAVTDFEDLEARNRAFLAGIWKAAAKEGSAVSPRPAGFQQLLFEAELGATAAQLEPIKVVLATAGDQVTATYNGETIATFTRGRPALTEQQSEMFARALRYFRFIHPAAIDAAEPFKTLPLEVSGVH